MKKAVKPIKSKPKSSKKGLDKSAKKVKKAPAKKAGGKVIKKKEIAKTVKKVVKPARPSGGKPVKPVKPVHSASKKVAAKPARPSGGKVIVKKVVKKLAIPAKPVKPLKKAVISLTISKKAVVAKPIASKAIVKPDKKDKLSKEKELKKTAKVEISKDPKVKAPRKSKGGRKPKNKDDEDEPVIEEDILIEQLINSTKRLKKPSKVPKQLRTFTNPMASLTVANVNGDNKSKKALPKKEPKGKFELEYVIRTSAGILYEFLTSPSGLSEWFADDVNIHDGVFTFFWEGSEQKARLLAFKEDKFVRLQWLDKPEGTYFEFRIERDELTGDISLMVVDFADEASDMETSKRLWDSQINTLLNVIGSY